jgi:hypothetical protein
MVVFGLLKFSTFLNFIFRPGDKKGIPQGLKPPKDFASERAKPEGLAYLEAKTKQAALEAKTKQAARGKGNEAVGRRRSGWAKAKKFGESGEVWRKRTGRTRAKGEAKSGGFLG